MEKLELKYLAPYLPYGLKFIVEISEFAKKELGNTAPYENRKFTLGNNFDLCLKHGKPILKPLSDLTDEFLIKLFNDLDLDIVRMKYGITINYKMMGDWFKEHISLRSYNNERCLTMSAWLYVALLENHIDVFGLIDKGLAVIEKDEIYQSLI